MKGKATHDQSTAMEKRMGARAWSSPSNTYGVRVGIQNRNRYFDRSWSRIEVEIRAIRHSPTRCAKPTLPFFTDANYRRTNVAGGTYFFTVNTLRRLPILTEAPLRTALRDAIRDIRSASVRYRRLGFLTRSPALHLDTALPGRRLFGPMSEDPALRVEGLRRNIRRRRIVQLTNQSA